ncbi:N-acetyltransferase [Oxalobacteraceae bacterium OM1]|nr:N-acetyltransferase [Oxalobacteraceae bacterium OM1]
MGHRQRHTLLDCRFAIPAPQAASHKLFKATPPGSTYLRWLYVTSVLLEPISRNIAPELLQFELKAFDELGLLRIEADARAENAASLRVMQKNGFVQYGHSKRSFEMGGIWYDRLHFERHKGA